MRHQHRADLLAHHLVGHADHRHLEHPGRGREHVLHLDAVDVLAAAVDHVLEPVDDVHPALVVDARHIALCSQPSRNVSAVASGLFQYPATTLPPRISSSPTPARRRRATVQVELEVHGGRGEADRVGVGVGPLVRQEGGDGRGLGQAESVAHAGVGKSALDPRTSDGAIGAPPYVAQRHAGQVVLGDIRRLSAYQ